MTSNTAKLHFIADQPKSTFWGSNEKEQRAIDEIRKHEAEIMQAELDSNPVIEKYEPLLEQVFPDGSEKFDDVIAMYEPIEIKRLNK